MNVWLEPGRKAIMLGFYKWADGSWSGLADGLIAFIYRWNFGSYGTSSFCFLCTCFLCMKRMPTEAQGLPKIKQRERSSCQKNLIPHACCLVMLPPRSTKNEHRHSVGARGEQTKKRTNELKCRQTREKPLHMLLAKCQAFSQIRLLQQERKCVKILCVEF